jgi:hypothetical protein
MFRTNLSRCATWAAGGTRVRGLLFVWIGVLLDYLTTWIGLQNNFIELNPRASPAIYGLIATLALLLIEFLRTSSNRRALTAYRRFVTSMVFYPFLHNLLALNGVI